MGATSIEVYQSGKDARDAYNKAVAYANDEYGHQQGYSGQINSSKGFALKNVPNGVSLNDWLNYIADFDGDTSSVPDEISHLKMTLKGQWKIYDNKWEPALAFEVTGEDLANITAKNKYIMNDGPKLFVFIGIVPE